MCISEKEYEQKKACIYQACLKLFHCFTHEQEKLCTSYPHNVDNITSTMGIRGNTVDRIRKTPETLYLTEKAFLHIIEVMFSAHSKE